MASTSPRFTATDKQYALIAKLLRERHESSPRRRHAISSALRSETLTKAEASATITELLTWKREGDEDMSNRKRRPWRIGRGNLRVVTYETQETATVAAQSIANFEGLAWYVENADTGVRTPIEPQPPTFHSDRLGAVTIPEDDPWDA